MLRPVYQRSYEGQLLRTRLRLRTSLVEARRSLINQVRGTLRAHGAPLSSCTSKSFVAHFATGPTPQDSREVLEPLVGAIGELTDRIEAIERELVEESHSDELIERLQQVPGVGPLVSLSFVAWVDRADRFAKSRDVGACLGAVRRDSALKRWAQTLVARVGKKRAVVALARKLAVLLHRLWVTRDSFRPFPAAV
jgi:transposase